MVKPMISSEFVIQAHKQGVTLARPDTPWLMSSPRVSVAEVLAFPMNIYFMSPDSMMRKINDANAESCGYLSAQDSIGKSIRDIASREAAVNILRNDQAILRAEQTQVVNESFNRLDDVPLTALSIKIPWYQDDKIVGILGCSILQGLAGAPSLPEALTLLIQAGLLAPAVKTSFTTALPQWEFSGNMLDQRDMEILYFLVRGRTAKSIAKQVQLSHRTIEHRLEAIKQKLMVSSKAELIEKVVDQFISVPAIRG